MKSAWNEIMWNNFYDWDQKGTTIILSILLVHVGDDDNDYDTMVTGWAVCFWGSDCVNH